ncbi:hypothetical protein COT97_05705 [Candidatus Falkowbacteria bacterium CG10_big_fil_rev_8_21_14_0_10_39_11]|uniref:Uncharacterized protein n=1 Tax=Candidatus Falkowbacteria bacterium CG10_big_fil_rev_8_21_14_0_10_39_11 TaxID=1974565 RepID=A0A2H0V3G0_9BACT|nr:MAG: hypothetical protein COT97_05705 [Candidatus Falkowbacteria bacterium CG10_big_fil_rev_8_21_14_0_10_39_11]
MGNVGFLSIIMVDDIDFSNFGMVVIWQNELGALCLKVSHDVFWYLADTNFNDFSGRKVFVESG